MAKLDKQWWQAISPLLDRALDLGEDERTQWLAELRAQDPSSAADLTRLLDERRALSLEGFLEGAAAPPVPAPLDPQTLGAYTLESPIGQGGMGTIWLARRSDGRFEGKAAVKLLNPSLAGRINEGRFEREGSILARLQHPNIAHLVDAGVSPAGQPYLILEYVEGEHIDRYCDARRLGVEARIRLFLDVLSAVAHAHASLIVHRDIKPSNVLVSTGGQVKLLDFGIAKLLEGEGAAASPTLTLEAGRMLTPEYAAPEQVSGGTITTATDVYALGVLLYVLLGGRHPAGALVRSPVDLLRAILETEPPRLSTAVAETATVPAADVTATAAALRGTTSDGLRRQLKGDLDTIVAKALKKDPGERYASVTALRDDLQRYLDHQPIGARPDTLAYRTARFVRRHRLPVALAALVLVALVCGLAGTAWQAREARRQRDRALAQLARAQGMNEFTTFLLGEAIPYGKPLTVRELLQRSEALVQARFTRDPALMVELLVGIGNVYGLRSEGEDTLRTMKRAYEASLRLSDPAVRAHAACAWAGTIYGDDEPGAQRLIDEALARLTPDPQFDSIAAACHVTRGQIGHMTGNSDMMLEGARKALERLGAQPVAASFLRADALHVLALGHHARGENGRSERAFAQTAEELKRIGGEQTNSAITLLNNWALTRVATDPLGALALQAEVLARDGGLAAGATSSTHLLNYGVYLNRVGRHADARPILEKSAALARAQGGGSTQGLAALHLGIACRQLGDLPCSAAAVGEGVEELKRAPDGSLYRGEVLQEPGMLAWARGDVDEAARLLGQARHVYEETKEKSVARLETLFALARLELQRRNGGAAEAHARQAVALAEEMRDDLPRSAWVGVGQVVLAEVLEARGDAAAARTLYSDALVQMGPTLGEGHPAVRAARTRLAGSAGRP